MSEESNSTFKTILGILIVIIGIAIAIFAAPALLTVGGVVLGIVVVGFIIYLIYQFIKPQL